MLKITFIFLSIVICANCASFSYEQVRDALFSNLRYLNSITTPLSQNASEYMVYIAAEAYQIPYIVGNFLTTQQKQDIEFIFNAVNPGIDETIQDNSCDPRTTKIFPPTYWAETGDYVFTRGRIPKVRPVSDSLYQIYLKSVYTEYGKNCNKELFLLNNVSETSRECISPCQEMLDNSTLECGISNVDDRTIYLANGVALNCSQYTPSYFLEKTITYCTYYKRQILAMYAHRFDPQFEDIRYYYLRKFIYCGPFGIVELYTNELIPEIVGSINCDGSVGSSRRSLEEKIVLTAQTAALLVPVMRLILEETYGIIRG